MEVVSYTELRNSLKSIMDRACYDHDPVIITRKSGEHMVLLSLEEFHQGKGIPFELKK